MNLLLLEANEVTGGVAVLTGRRAEHLRKVLKVTIGRELRAGIVDGPRATAVVSNISDHDVVVDVAIDDALPPAPLPLTLWLAMPRPLALGRVLQTVATFGIARVELTNAWRVDKSYFGSPKVRTEAIREDLLLGAEQGGTTRLPVVTVHDRLLSLVERGVGDASYRLLAHPYDAQPLEQVVTPGPMQPTIVAIGPEGGWIDRELESLETAGFTRVSLCQPVLRTDTAVTTLLAQLMLLGRMGHDEKS